MKASELIKELTALMLKHGDLDVKHAPSEAELELIARHFVSSGEVTHFELSFDGSEHEYCGRD